jgi:hypothetical protein
LLNRYEARLQRTCRNALESLRTLREIQELQNDPNPKIEHSPEPPDPQLPRAIPPEHLDTPPAGGENPDPDALRIRFDAHAEPALT